MRRGSDAIALSKERSRLALRLAGLRLRRPAGFHPQARASAAPPGGQAPYPRLCRMAAYMPYPAYVPEEACGTPPRRPSKRSAAGRSGAVPAAVPDGGIHALSGLQKIAFPPNSSAGQSAPCPGGVINSLSLA
ncbi:hypothetical protein F3G24_10630 [Klebsiella pneumoniae]|nr:hypothetical protein F3G23_13475 [Klebsiella pneumoniae]KAA5699606.1 hypothetical protein F3G32_07035 [Klebsiella pneumoniae]KAA5713506.1 hypothetical protein F3G30_16760 [Klebsiella pneumoniae]KAA5715462.1 hypothetical protein F3G29_23910 [Klebsiella pneumoniae]KAA5731773.1 hypothetical protein F3G25_25045 [Klebsiella pneumoniae]